MEVQIGDWIIAKGVAEKTSPRAIYSVEVVGNHLAVAVALTADGTRTYVTVPREVIDALFGDQ